MSTKVEKVRQRNFDIMRFRCTAPYVLSLIPDDILVRLKARDLDVIYKAQIVYKKVIIEMNKTSRCNHYYDEENICNNCGHKKFSRDGKGKGRTWKVLD